jgi:hypothetical protein
MTLLHVTTLLHVRDMVCVKPLQVGYWWYKKLKAEYPDSPMGGYTRLLHGWGHINLIECVDIDSSLSLWRLHAAAAWVGAYRYY